MYGNVIIQNVKVLFIYSIAICEPICEAPKCKTQCGKPSESACTTECQPLECEIKCPDNACEKIDCPKCINSCKDLNCKTSC